MRQSVVVNEWKAVANVEAKVEGIQRLLSARLGVGPADVAARLAETHDLNVLQTWLILAGQAATLDGFCKGTGLPVPSETSAG